MIGGYYYDALGLYESLWTVSQTCTERGRSRRSQAILLCTGTAVQTKYATSRRQIRRSTITRTSVSLAMEAMHFSLSSQFFLAQHSPSSAACVVSKQAFYVVSRGWVRLEPLPALCCQLVSTCCALSENCPLVR